MIPTTMGVGAAQPGSGLMGMGGGLRSTSSAGPQQVVGSMGTGPQQVGGNMVPTPWLPQASGVGQQQLNWQMPQAQQLGVGQAGAGQQEALAKQQALAEQLRASGTVEVQRRAQEKAALDAAAAARAAEKANAVHQAELMTIKQGNVFDEQSQTWLTPNRWRSGTDGGDGGGDGDDGE
jgi:hypothetical protein